MAEWLDRRYGCAPPAPVLELLRRARVYRDQDEAPTNALRNRITVPRAIATPATSGLRPTSGQIARAVLGASLKLRRSSLHSIISSRQSRTPLPYTGNSAPALEIADRFERARILVPVARDCLLDSLALDALLASRNLGSQFVFGIAPRPFEAHCWLQTSETILNDSFDHVSRFTPILAI